MHIWELDFSAAFDRDSNSPLIYKLCTAGVAGRFLKILTQFLTKRMQRVSVEGNFSDLDSVVMVRSGVPPGSVIGPLHFILYTSDMWHDIESSMITYADDTTLFAHIDHAHSRALDANQLNADLGTITDWCSI